MVQLSCTDTHFNFYKVFKHFNDNFVRYFMFGLKYVETTIEYISFFLLFNISFIYGLFMNIHQNITLYVSTN